MIDDSTVEAAAMHVFGLLEGDEARAFAERLEGDADLRQYVDELEATVAQLAHDAAPLPLPPSLEQKILQEIHIPEEAPSTNQDWVSWLGWAAAACLATACFWLNHDRAQTRQESLAAQEERQQARQETEQTRQQLQQAQQERLQAQQERQQALEQTQKAQKELAGLRQRDVLARMQIATLTSKLAQAKNATAVVVWDEAQQRGVLKLSQMPAPAAGHDYELWVIDPQYKQPVSAGVFEVGRPELTRVSFQAARPIGAAQKFAVSLEAKGGGQEVKGPIVMISD